VSPQIRRSQKVNIIFGTNFNVPLQTASLKSERTHEVSAPKWGIACVFFASSGEPEEGMMWRCPFFIAETKNKEK